MTAQYSNFFLLRVEQNFSTCNFYDSLHGNLLLSVRGICNGNEFRTIDLLVVGTIDGGETFIFPKNFSVVWIYAIQTIICTDHKISQ